MNQTSDDIIPTPAAAGGKAEDGAPGKRDVAIALSHNADRGELPRVIAAGRGAVARQILEVAFARGIKVREDADLAEVLAAVDVDSEIPLAAFAAVAEILSYVYRAQGAPQAAPHAPPPNTTPPHTTPPHPPETAGDAP